MVATLELSTFRAMGPEFRILAEGASSTLRYCSHQPYGYSTPAIARGEHSDGN